MSNLKLGIEHTVKNIINTPVRQKNGMYYQLYENFFDETFLKELEETKDSNVELTLLEMQEDKTRRLVSYDEHISKKLNVFFHSAKIVETLKNVFQCKNLTTKRTDMWYDYKGYHILPHIDEGYQLSIQVYLNNENQPATGFYEKTETGYKLFDQATYKSNHGYCIMNTGTATHGMVGTVTSGKRKSIFARFE